VAGRLLRRSFGSSMPIGPSVPAINSGTHRDPNRSSEVRSATTLSGTDGSIGSNIVREQHSVGTFEDSSRPSSGRCTTLGDR
jgi:hypothetical protein